MPTVEDPTTHRLVSVRRHGGERTLVVLAREHRIAYLRIGAAAAPFVEAALSRRVVANRVAEAHLSPPSLTLRPWRTERRGFAAGLRRLAARYGALVFADVADCYATISPPVVGDRLDRLGVPEPWAAADLLGRLAEAGILGLPVGPSPSAVLANAVLSHVDRTLEDAHVPHLRWVDDVVMGVRDPSEATRVLDLFARALSELGLRPNAGKTRVVVDPSSVALAPSGLRGRAERLG